MLRMNTRFEIHQPILQPGKIIDLLAQAIAEHGDFSKQQLKHVMQKGAVWLERAGEVQRVRRATKPVQAGDVLHVYYDAAILATVPLEPELVADAGAYSVWDKPYGMLCQGSKWGDHCTLARWVEQYVEPQRPAFVVHRLDRAASGLVLLVHSKKVAKALAALFAKRQVDKRYRVWVAGEFPAEPQMFEQPIDEKEARSSATLLRFDADKNQSLLEVQIETGRKHQIRVHLAGAGFPVVGDRLHGSATAADDDLQLMAASLAFSCPVSGEQQRFSLV